MPTREWNGPTYQKDGDYVFGIIYRSQRNKEFAVIFSFLGISIAAPIEFYLHD